MPGNRIPFISLKLPKDPIRADNMVTLGLRLRAGCRCGTVEACQKASLSPTRALDALSPQLQELVPCLLGSQQCSPQPPGPRGRKVSGRTQVVAGVGEGGARAPPGTGSPSPAPLATGPGRGRVEVLYAGGWGTVCDDDWDFADARVACREAGCGPALGATGLGHFGYGRGPVLLDNVGCAGTEARLSDCFHLGWGQHNCGHHEDAGALCSGEAAVGPRTRCGGGGAELRLRNGRGLAQACSAAPA